MLLEYGIAAVKAVLIPLIALTAIPVLVWLERRGSAFIQNRKGPNRANLGPFTFAGLLHPICDVFKAMTKEPFRPAQAHWLLYPLAPALVVVPAIMALGVLPLADTIDHAGLRIPIAVTEMEYGILYIFAISSLTVLGITVAGWASNNKYSLMGGVRSTAQMISYELSLGLSVMGVLLVYASLNPNELARGQGALLWGVLPMWGIVVQPLGFLLFLIASFAEANRLPFDLPEGESELVAGYHTEYAGMKFPMFYMAEYLAMVTLSALIVTLFFGGWQVPWYPTEKLDLLAGQWGRLACQLVAFGLKTAFFLWFFIWVRWTLPRFRYDQLMQLGWKVILPLSLLNVVLTALVLLVVRY